MGRFLSPFIDAVDAMLFIINLKSISQAGRRGFEPRLPLHLFNNLEEEFDFFHSKTLH